MSRVDVGGDTRFVASDAKTTNLPSALMAPLTAKLFAGRPDGEAETRVTLPVRRSFLNCWSLMTLLPGANTRDVDANSTHRPSALMASAPPPTPSWPPELVRSIRLVMPVHMSRTKASTMLFVSRGTRFAAHD